MSVRVGIISDTHDLLRPEVLKGLQGCDYILHAGDVTQEYILDQIRFIGRLYVVRGNNDFGWASCLSKKQKFKIEGVRFVMIHDVTQLGGDCRDADIVVYGHTHHYSAQMRDGRLWLNPGTCGYPRFGGGVSYVIMEIDGDKYTYKKIEIN